VETGVSVTEAELIRLAAQAEAAGAIEPTDRELIERAFVVGDVRIGEILVPRIDVIAVAEGTPVREALDMAVAAGHRRLPVYGRDLDDVTGLVRIRDMARVVADGGHLPVSGLRRDVLVVPETRRLIDVLRDMQRDRTSMAVVIDEYGGTAGIATIEDVVEELVGEITDDDVARVPEIRRVGRGRWIVEGGADVRDLGEALGADLPRGDWSTAAGLVIALAGRIPGVGDHVSIAGFRFEVRAATRRRVRRIEVVAGNG
jgi:CBS domain containing-hemolysin-like protein